MMMVAMMMMVVMVMAPVVMVMMMVVMVMAVMNIDHWRRVGRSGERHAQRGGEQNSLDHRSSGVRANRQRNSECAGLNRK